MKKFVREDQGNGKRKGIGMVKRKKGPGRKHGREKKKEGKRALQHSPLRRT